MNFHFLQEIQFLIVCWKQWVLYCITWVLAYHIYIFWIDACAQNSTNVTYVFVSKKDKKRTYYKCLGKLYNQNFEIRKCQHYCLHTIIRKNALNELTVINTGFQDLHIKDDLWSSDDHLVIIYCFITSKQAAVWITDFMLLHVIFVLENRIANLLVVLMEYLSYKHNLNHLVGLKH